MRFKDKDTGESCMDVVRVHEGWSFQVWMPQQWGEGAADYVSVILSVQDALDLADMLGLRSGPMRSKESPT